MLRSRKQVVLRVVWRLVACMFLAFLAMLISISATETDPTLLYFVAFAISSIMLPLACIWFVKVGERNYSLPLRLLLPLVYFGLLFSIPMTEWPLRFTLAIYQRPLQRLVDRTLAGSTVTFPQRIGPFVIYKTSREDPGIASLWHRLKGPFFFGVLLAKPGTTIFSGSFMVLQPY